MPVTLDPSLPPSLYPLAWLIGSWHGFGATHQPTPEGAVDRRVEQQLDCVALEDGTLAWTSLVHVIDDPAPLPPTSVFTSDDVPTPTPAGSGERSLLMRESGIWTVGEPLPGQDLAAAEKARPGEPAAVISYGLQAHFDSERADGAEDWAGEVRGPRIQLARRSADGGVAATRMFGYVGGRLMWLWERRDRAGDTAADLTPYLSLELDRV